MKKITLLVVALLGLGIGTGKAQYTDLLNFNGTNGSEPIGDVTVSGNKMYGMTEYGGADNRGLIFSMNTDGSGYRDLLDFNNTNGSNPYGSLTLSGSVLFGMATGGGAIGDGCVFHIDTDGSNYKDLLDFNNTNGRIPYGSLTLSGKVLYGMTYSGGFGPGVVFSIDTDGTRFRDLLNFDSTQGSDPYGSLLLVGNKLYGMTMYGGIYADGNIFSIDTDGNGFKDLFDFNGTNGENPLYASLTLFGSLLFGTTLGGGADNHGCIFSVDTNGNNFTDRYDFALSYYGEFPSSSLTLSGNILYGIGHNGGLYLYGSIFSFDTNGNVYTDLLDFEGTNNPEGANPWGALTFSSGVLYGMANLSGPNDDGVVFSFIPPCTFTVTISNTLSCNGSNNATSTASPSGGTSPYTYSWNNGQTNATATGLSAGTYTVYITDNVGCTGSGTATITQPPLLQDSINSSCATCCNCKGTTHVYVWGGTPPYTYSWSNGRTNDSLEALSSDTFRVTITDANGCSIKDSVFVTQGPPVSGSQTNVLCYGGNTGSASITVTGNYSYSWSPGGESTSSVSGLSAGSYTATVTNIDTLGCSGSLAFTIAQPTALSGGLTICCWPYNTFSYCADTFCYNVGAIGTGGVPPYTFNFSPGLGVTCHSEDFTTATITDANGCVYTLPPADADIYVGLSIRAFINNNVSCNGENDGSAMVNIQTGGLIGTFPTYSWSPGGGTNGTQANLSAGTYTVTVAGGVPTCTVTAVIAITQPPALSLTADSISATTGNCNGSAWANVSGGTAPYTYSWTGGLNTDTINNQCAGYYCCTITDAGGCIDSVCTNIETTTGTKELTMDNGQLTIYPNPNEGKFTIELAVGSGQSWVEIYNVLGEKVYATILPQTPKGALNEIDLSSQPDGVYFYRVLYEDGGLIGEGKLIIQK